MKRLAIAITAAAMVMGAGAAYATKNIAGTVQRVDEKARQVMLDSGQTFNVAANVRLDTVVPGDLVSITADDQTNVALKIDPIGSRVGAAPPAEPPARAPAAPDATPRTVPAPEQPRE